MTARGGAPALTPSTETVGAFVAARRDAAETLGARLAELVGEPDVLANELIAGLEALADPAYVASQQVVAPGIGATIGVRWPLLAAVSRRFRRATAQDRASMLLLAADRLFREPTLEPRWFAFGVLERTVLDDPERSWQLLRRAAREAGDWITVDTLAHPYGRGILHEPYRWAELEQLVYAPSRWERRLVGATIATIPHVDRRLGRQRDVVVHGLDLLAELIGDGEPDVQKALAWAYRTLAPLDPGAVVAHLDHEATRSAATHDGNRAWVVRDALSKLPAPDADRIRTRLGGIRRRSGAPSTSRAAAIAAQYASMGLGAVPPEPPLA